MSFMGSFVGGMAGRFAVPVVGAAGFGAYKTGALEGLPLPLPTAPSHYEMSARIVSVESACRLRFRENGQLRQTQPMDCTRAVDVLKQPLFKDYEVFPIETVEYIYYAPDGQSTLSGTTPGLNDKNGRAYQKGAVIQIRVDAKDPTKSEVI